MAYLTISGITVRVSSFRRLEDERSGGEVRTISGQLRGGPVWTKRAWEVDGFTVNDTDANTIRAAISAHAAVNVAGDAMGGATVPCRVRITGDEAFPRNPTTRVRKLSFSIREA